MAQLHPYSAISEDSGIRERYLERLGCPNYRQLHSATCHNVRDSCTLISGRSSYSIMDEDSPHSKLFDWLLQTRSKQCFKATLLEGR
jgi:hypothetical protein